MEIVLIVTGIFILVLWIMGLMWLQDQKYKQKKEKELWK